LVGPLLAWSYAALWAPILAPAIPSWEAWGWGVAALAGSLGSLFLHAWMHRWVSHGSHITERIRIPVSLFGDAAQCLPATDSPWREALAALAGPVTNLALAAICYLLWNLQLALGLNEWLIFLVLFNLLVAVGNLTPGYPLDGGRLARALLASWMPPSAALRLTSLLGRVYAIALAGWALTLVLLRARFSLEIGLALFLLAGLLLWLSFAPVAPDPLGEKTARTKARGPRKKALVGVTVFLLFLLAALSSGIVPLAEGLEMPGLALAVEPMIIVDSSHAHEKPGQFLLTSVINQTPILLGQRLLAIWDPSVRIIPPEQVVPPDTTPQQMMEVNFQALEESQLNATLVAFQLAGYEASLTGDGAGVRAVLPESPAAGRLQAGDIITSLDGQPIATVEDLIAGLRTRSPSSIVNLTVQREQEELPAGGCILPAGGWSVHIQTGLLPGSEPGDPPRIGILAQTAGLRVETPFPVSIRPQKIVGGPSAGLIFTLTLYNRIAVEDLTRGRTIAGTGTIDAEGRVGPIGGVEQKVVAAARAGASDFLCPSENFADAKMVAQGIRVWAVQTAQEAIDLLRREALTP
ncbi:MAG: PDZ domain-containing protein, partial [Coprothermobacterota bacterium]|nr:PDZ domain-containing protein [Coprothermobacterota bacterium]